MDFQKGPTFPKAPELNRKLLDFLGREIIAGATGPRIVMGDYNIPSNHEAFCFWRLHGWESAQTFAQRHFGWKPLPTSKGRQERDMIWLSPEVQKIMTGIHHQDIFAEHSTLSIDILVPSQVGGLQTWPRPSPIPWDRVSDDWTCALPPGWHDIQNSTQQYQQLWTSMESSLKDHIGRPECSSLTSAECGRAQRLTPLKQQPMQPLCRPARQGEVQLRHDLTGNAVRQWFRQLRRLQSLVHALQQGKMHLAAIEYRIGLWTSIVRAPGFAHGFRAWWNRQRPHNLEDTPPTLPMQVPDLSTAQKLFRTFRLNFEKFESWHLRQRGKQLQQRHDQSMKHLYQELKDPAKGQPNIFYAVKEHEVKMVNADNVVVVDPPPPHIPQQIWHAGDVLIPATADETGHLSFDQDFLVQPGALLQSTSMVHSVSDMHHDLLQHWVQRWQARVQPKHEEWQRMLDFFRAHMPTIHLRAPPIEPDQWQRVLKKYKKTAARGLDGVSHEDLRHLPTALQDGLLHMLTQIEQGRQPWPQQVLKGQCAALAKTTTAHCPGDFRPIVILSLTYRTWGALRARQLIHQLAPYADVGQFGFLPGNEPLQLWLSLQSQIEEALLLNNDIQGITTDLVRAFNNIPRPHTRALAQHLGMPATVLNPWMSFLDSFERAFTIDNFISDFVGSSVGMPEGDSLSVYSMIQLDMAFHTYMRVFAPAVQSFSYVDNLMLRSSKVTDLLGGWAALQTFFELWNLQTDPRKTYGWGLTKTSRDALSFVDIPVCQNGSELGGAMTYGRCYTVKHFHDRAASLDQKWERLRRSSAPLRQKELALYMVFWPKALHGTHAVPVSHAFLSTLRTSALKGLRLGKAGTNALLRLSIPMDMRSDPGFYRVSSLCRDFVRLCGKDDEFRSRWIHLGGSLGSTSRAGPYAVLREELNSLGWRVEPPMIIDRDGVKLSLLVADSRELDFLLQDAWCQHVTERVRHRHLMNDLTGIDMILAKAVTLNCTAQDAAILAAIQSGTFLSAHSQSKFDLTKVPMRTLCGVKNDHVHWLKCPHFNSHRPDIWPLDLDFWPTCLTAHLLPPPNPHIHPLKVHLHTLQDCSWDFWPDAGDGPQHLFTDGSAWRHEHPWLSRASWAVLNASTGAIVAAATVPGLWQTNDKAEIWAIMAALQWSLTMSRQIHIWTDSKFAADSLAYVLQNGYVPHTWENRTEWLRILHLLEQLHDILPYIHWIPSHMEPLEQDDPFAEWWSEWNGRVDRLAAHVNLHRGTEYAALRQAALAHHDAMKAKLGLLSRFYCSVAHQQQAKPPTVVIPDDTIAEFDLDYVLLAERLPLTWQHSLNCAQAPKKVHIPYCICTVAICSSYFGISLDGHSASHFVHFRRA